MRATAIRCNPMCRAISLTFMGAGDQERLHGNSRNASVS